MKSVGEVMAIGRTFKEALLKAVRSLETGKKPGTEEIEPKILIQRLVTPHPERLSYLRYALRQGHTVKELSKMTSIDPWFLYQLKEITDTQLEVEKHPIESVPDAVIREAKRAGISDNRLATAWRVTNGRGAAEKIRHLRKSRGVTPVYKHVDTCAAEFESYTPYLYSTYEDEDEAAPTAKKKVIILGAGPNRIGQGIEFDYCCCHAAFALRDDGYETIMVNCNPETVSTDYDTSDRLYFEPLTLEDVMAVYEHEARSGAPIGVIVQFGGQTPLNLALPLKAAGVPIIGTSPESIDLAEDRKRFGKLLDELQIPQPPGAMATSIEEAVAGAHKVGYPVLVRPSYVLGGRAMVIAYDDESVVKYMKEAVEYSQERPVLVDHFLEAAIEVDVDALSDGEDVVIGGIMQHIEEAGIHSGDSSCVLPSVDLSPEVLATLRDYTFRLARALKVIGLMNVQYAIQKHNGDSKVFVLEVNPRASRTVPFVSKATGVPLAKIASRLMTGRKLREFLPENIERAADLDTGPYSYVKSPVFPVVQVSRGGHRARPGDEVHRRGHGHGRQLRRGLRQGADRRRQSPADPWRCLHQRHRSRQAAGGRHRATLRRSRLPPGRHQRHGKRPGSSRADGRARVQGERRPSQRRRPDQGRPYPAHRQHAPRRRALVRRKIHSPRRRHPSRPVHHHPGRRARRRRRHRRPAAGPHQRSRPASAACATCRRALRPEFDPKGHGGHGGAGGRRPSALLGVGKQYASCPFLRLPSQVQSAVSQVL